MTLVAGTPVITLLSWEVMMTREGRCQGVQVHDGRVAVTRGRLRGRGREEGRGAVRSEVRGELRSEERRERGHFGNGGGGSPQAWLSLRRQHNGGSGGLPWSSRVHRQAQAGWQGLAARRQLWQAHRAQQEGRGG